MRQCLGVILALLLILAPACVKNNPAEKQLEHSYELQEKANQVVSEIQYMKDPRTGVCFAYYYWEGYNGGPALATVPCDSIPSDLLKVAVIKNKE